MSGSVAALTVTPEPKALALSSLSFGYSNPPPGQQASWLPGGDEPDLGSGRFQLNLDRLSLRSPHPGKDR
jgi:hypothetical protein